MKNISLILISLLILSAFIAGVVTSNIFFQSQSTNVDSMDSICIQMGDETNIVGSWLGWGGYQTIEFLEDGTYETSNGDDGTWYLEGEVIVIRIGQRTDAYSCHFLDNYSKMVLEYNKAGSKLGIILYRE